MAHYDEGVHIADNCTIETHLYRYIKKDGSLGRWLRFYAWYTPLQDCEFCGKRSTPKNINTKCIFLRKEWLIFELCMPCFMKLTIHVNKIKTLDDLSQITKKIRGASRGNRKNNS